MSEEIAVIKGTGIKEVEMQLTQFWGGTEKGTMLQVAQGFGGHLDGDMDEPGFIQLTFGDAYKLSVELSKWIKTQLAIKGDNLQKVIDQNKELQKTIFSEMRAIESWIYQESFLDFPVCYLGKMQV